MQIINDFSTSVSKALEEIDPNYKSYLGLVVCGTHQKKTKKQVNQMISQIKTAREKHIPFLGECFGFQLMAIEWVRTMAGFKMANSTELDKKTPNPVVVKMKERKTGIAPVTWFDGKITYESHWHNYSLNPYYLRYFPQKLWDVSFGEHAIEIVKLKKSIHPFFWGTQFHISYQSSKDKPHKLLMEFLKAAKKAYESNYLDIMATNFG